MEDRVEHIAPTGVNHLAVAKYEAPRALFLAGIPKIEAELAAVDVQAAGAELVVGDISGRVHQAKAKADALRKREAQAAEEALDAVRGWWRPITEALDTLAATAKRKASDALFHKRQREEDARKKAEAVLEEARRAEIAGLRIFQDETLAQR
jgi:threonine synthase